MNCDLCHAPIEAAKVGGRYTTLDAKPITVVTADGTKVKGRTVHLTTCTNREQRKKVESTPEEPTLPMGDAHAS